MNLKTSIFLTLFSFALCFFADAETVTFSSAQNISSNDPAVDLTDSGKWFIQLNQDDWKKTIARKQHRLYPDKANRAQAVINDQGEVRANISVYVKEAIESGFYTVDGKGLDLKSVNSIKVIAVRINDGIFCKAFIRPENKQYVLNLFENQNDETAAAATARNRILTKLGNIETLSNAGKFFR